MQSPKGGNITTFDKLYIRMMVQYENVIKLCCHEILESKQRGISLLLATVKALVYSIGGTVNRLVALAILQAPVTSQILSTNV